MNAILKDERGMALAIAIFAMVIAGAMIAGAFFAGTQEQRVGENQRRVQAAFAVAEAGAQERVLSWNPTTMNNRPQWPRDSVAIGPAPSGIGSYGGYSYRVGPNLWLLDVTGLDRASASGPVAGGGARQRVGIIARIAPVQFGIQASLTTQGSVAMSGNATISGVDQIPTGWTSCGLPGPPQAGIRDQGGNVTQTPNTEVTGTPKVINDPTINNNTFTVFGGATYADLAARASIQLPGGNYKIEPVVTNGTCNRKVLTNWGDGMNPNQLCGTYFPIIHIAGSVTLTGDQGQGILLVDGDLNVTGSFQFFGVTIIQGDLKTSGEAHFWGGVMAKNADLSPQNISGKATLNFSSCTILAALQATSPISMMRQRGWVALY